MPRYARKKSESGIFHVMLRGINKQTIFEDDEDRKRFLDTIQRYKIISKYEIYGYCLMSKHVHLLLKETEKEISTAIKRICSSYVYWYNWKYGRCGHCVINEKKEALASFFSVQVKHKILIRYPLVLAAETESREKSGTAQADNDNDDNDPPYPIAAKRKSATETSIFAHFESPPSS